VEIDVEASAEKDNVQNNAEKESTALMMQFRLVPVAEHPLFPGSSQALQITEDQYEVFKDGAQPVVFASVVKDDGKFKNDLKKFQAMADPAQDQYQDFKMPRITSLDDIYDVGTLCEARASKDEGNAFMPFVLNIFPREKAKLISGIQPNQIVEPLCPILVEKINDLPITEDELPDNTKVLF